MSTTSASERFRCGHLPGSIGILEPLEKTMPIRILSAIGRTERYLAVWTRVLECRTKSELIGASREETRPV